MGRPSVVAPNDKMRWVLGAVALVVSLGCETNNGPDSAPGEPSAATPSPAATAPSPGAKASDAAEGADAPDAAAALRAAVARGIVGPAEGGSTWVVDPFVLAWIVASVEENGDRWLTRYEAAADGVTVQGWQVRAPDESPLHALGLQDGDIIEEVLGVPASDIERVKAVVARAQNRVSLTVHRVDFSLTLSYRIEPALGWTTTRAALAGTDTPPERHDIFAERRAVAHDRAGDSPAATRAGSPAKPLPSSPSSTTGKPRPSGSGSSGKGSSGSGSSRQVSCSSASSCTVKRAYFTSMVASPSKLQSQANVVPAIRNDVHSGYKLKSVKSGSAVHGLGFRSGDKVTHVNGYDLTNDFEALALYAGINSTKTFKVRYVRGGKTLNKTIRVQ